MGKAIGGCLGVLASIATILGLLLAVGIIPNPFSPPPPPWGTGYTKIINRYSGLALEVNSFNPNPGGRVDLWGVLNQTNEEWKIVDNHDGYYNIVSRSSGLDLEIHGSSPSNGGLADQWTALNQTNEEWKIVDNGNGYYNIVNRFSGLVLEDNNFNPSNGATVDQWTALNQTNEEWTFQPVQ